MRKIQQAGHTIFLEDRRQQGDISAEMMQTGIDSSTSDQHLVEVSTKASWLKKNSNELDKKLVAILGTICFLLIVGFILVCYQYIVVLTTRCTSEICVKSAANLLASMDDSVDPCEDFYNFACGRWPKEHPTRDSHYGNDWFTEKRWHIASDIQEFLYRNDNDKEPNAVHQARAMFRACMNTEAIEALRFSGIEEVLETVGLTFLPPSNGSDNFNWMQTSVSAKLELNRDLLLSLAISVDPQNQTINRLGINKPETASPLPPSHKDFDRKVRKQLLEEITLEEEGIVTEGVKAYYHYVISVIKLFHEYKNETITVEEISNKYLPRIKDTFLLINEIHELIENRTDTDAEAEIYKLGDLQNLTDGYSSNGKRYIDWRDYFSQMFANVENVTLSLEDDDVILVYNVEFFEGLIQVIEQSSPQAIEFMFWLDIVQLLAPHTTKDLRRLNQDFIEALTGLPDLKSREVQCTESVMQLMGMAVSYSMLNEEYLSSVKERVGDMLKNIRWAFEKLIERVDWMDKPTKTATMEKAEAMGSLIGYPDWLSEPGQLDEYYTGCVVLNLARRIIGLSHIDYRQEAIMMGKQLLIENCYPVTFIEQFFVEVLNSFDRPDYGSQLGVNEDTYLDNLRNMTRLLVDNMLYSLDVPNDLQKVWAVDPIDVNAFHTIQANAITIPIGILRYPFYNLGIEALNYGAIGSIIGHELTHGFDDTGRKYDKTGNKLPWWSQKTINTYVNKTVCFVDHYNSYFIPEVNQSVDGVKTLDENIADNGGLREAIWAYRHYVKNNGQEKTLPGLEKYNHEQLLFLSFANLWCDHSTPASLKWDIKDTHCPNRIRVQGVLANSPEFASTWNCRAGSAMNPKKPKCQLW